MTEPARAMPELFACERLSARLTVKACGARFLRVRASTPGQQDYDSACDRCPIGEHHAKHGTLCPDTTTQTDMGATVLGDVNGELLCELSDRLYLLGDVNGPWAVEVATQEDLAL